MTSNYYSYAEPFNKYCIKTRDIYKFIYELTLEDNLVIDSVIEHIRWCLKDCDFSWACGNPVEMFIELVKGCSELTYATPHSQEKLNLVDAKLKAALDVYSVYLRETDRSEKLFWTSILSVMTGITATKVFEIIDKVLDITVDYDYCEHN